MRFALARSVVAALTAAALLLTPTAVVNTDPVQSPRHQSSPTAETPAPSSDRATPTTSATTESSTATGSTTTDLPAPVPVVDGNRLEDARTGERLIPRGVDWPSFEYACRQGWAYSAPIRERDAAALEAWHVSIVRLPLNQDCWLGLEGAPKSDAWQTRTVAGYRDRVERWVDRLNDHGIVVLLDLHWSAPAGEKADAQRAMADAQSVDFWASVAERFAAHPSVMFDLFNEPYSQWGEHELTWECWADGGCVVDAADDGNPMTGRTFEVAGMHDLVAAVRGAGAEQPIVLSGLDYANTLSAIDGSGADWLRSRPDDDQLVAGWHAYPGQGCDTRSCWNDEVASVADEVPVLITETGQQRAYATEYLDGLWSWALEHDLGWMQWAWWVFDPGEGEPGFRYEIIEDDERFEPTPGPGSLLRWGLAATAPGAKPLDASGRGSGSTPTVDGTATLHGSVKRGDETTVLVWVHRANGNTVARVHLTAKGGGAKHEVTSRRVELFDEWTPIALRVSADRPHDRLILEVRGGIRMRDVRGVRIR